MKFTKYSFSFLIVVILSGCYIPISNVLVPKTSYEEFSGGWNVSGNRVVIILREGHYTLTSRFYKANPSSQRKKFSELDSLLREGCEKHEEFCENLSADDKDYFLKLSNYKQRSYTPSSTVEKEKLDYIGRYIYWKKKDKSKDLGVFRIEKLNEEVYLGQAHSIQMLGRVLTMNGAPSDLDLFFIKLENNNLLIGPTSACGDTYSSAKLRDRAGLPKFKEWDELKKLSLQCFEQEDIDFKIAMSRGRMPNICDAAPEICAVGLAAAGAALLFGSASGRSSSSVSNEMSLDEAINKYGLPGLGAGYGR